MLKIAPAPSWRNLKKNNMQALIRKNDSFGKATYFTIVGMNVDDCFDHVSDLNNHAYHCQTGSHFWLVATREEGVWYSVVDGRKLSDEYIKELL